ncbi:MAG: glycine cleavage system protein GcvH [Firmicutes bacterium]|nr:glycine cleavage system protein GcvH [Bacillota bacterium]
MYPADLKYSREHEWVKVDGTKATIGITFFAQKELGDVVFVELPEAGETITANESFAVVESVKSVSDVYAPVSGKVLEVNAALGTRPELINEDPYGSAWIAVVEMSSPEELEELITAEEYQRFTLGDEADE